MDRYTIALAGNPNCGKTTLFNTLTGSKQKVGNWPGVTVERIEGSYEYRDHHYELIDLPGIYSFSAYSLDEKVSREFILKDKPDLVINIVDATNLERTLYLTTQLLEMKNSLIVALNMMDIAHQKKIHIEIGKKITLLMTPMGIQPDNWPATVGLITGIFAKETVVGTLDALYSQMEDNRKNEIEFDFWQGINRAFKLIPAGFKDIGAAKKDSINKKIDTSETEIIASDLDLYKDTFAVMKKKFSDSRNRAFAYLLFILIYMPCIAVIAVIAKEAGKGWAFLSLSYLTPLAWIISTLYYQISTFTLNPTRSFVFILICLTLLGGIYLILKFYSLKIAKRNKEF